MSENVESEHFTVRMQGAFPTFTHHPSGEACAREDWMMGSRSATWAFKLRSFRNRFPGASQMFDTAGMPKGAIDDLPVMGGTPALGDLLVCHDPAAGRSYARAVVEKVALAGGLPGDDSDVLLLEDGSMAVFDKMSCSWKTTSAFSDAAGLWSHRVAPDDASSDMRLDMNAVTRAAFQQAAKQADTIRRLPWDRIPLLGSPLYQEAAHVVGHLQHAADDRSMAETVRRAGDLATALLDGRHHRPRGHRLYDPLETLKRIARCLDKAMVLRQAHPDHPDTEPSRPCM